MADAHRLMIRLSPEIYAQLEARGSSGQPLAAIVRQALIDYLARQPEQLQQPRAATEQPEQLQQPEQLEHLDYMQERMTALTTTLQELQDHVRALTARVNTLAA